MLYPIAKVMRSARQKEGIVFFDSETMTTKYLKLAEIQQGADKYQFAGLYCTNRVIRLYKFFKNIGELGDDVDHPESFTIVQKQLCKGEIRYLMVDTLGNMSTANKEDLIQLMDAGVIINGFEIQSNGRMLFSSDIETVIVQEDNLIPG